jgi:xylan 1,4-beta-xylosidase
VAREIGFRGVRFHGVLDNDMSIYGGARPVNMSREQDFAFYNLDQVYDYLLFVGVRPIVELSFLPLPIPGLIAVFMALEPKH